MIRVTDIHKSFGTLEVLKGVSLDVAQGEVVSIVGASGAGKTTLLQIIGTLSRPDCGRVEIDGRDVSGLGDRALSQFRNERIGFVFQFHHLLAEFSAFENVCIPGLIGRRPRAGVERRAAELLGMMGSRRAATTSPDSFRAASSSAWPLPVRWSILPPCCSRTNPRATSTRITATRSTACSSTCANGSARPS